MCKRKRVAWIAPQIPPQYTPEYLPKFWGVLFLVQSNPTRELSFPRFAKETRCTYLLFYVGFKMLSVHRTPASKRRIPLSHCELLHFPQVLWLKTERCWTMERYCSKQNRTGGVMKLCWIIHWVLNDAERIITVNTPESRSSTRDSPACAVRLTCFPR